MNQRMRRYWAPKETQEFFPNEKWCFLCCCSVRVPFCNPSPRERSILFETLPSIVQISTKEMMVTLSLPETGEGVIFYTLAIKNCYVLKIQAFDYGKRSWWRLGTSS
ncbi:unnamed protein product [Larinioides sclopetarius]|uniref:Uncharacterized protein n=1 Tax=Larinioides sclopetarius TaxID=280406 RepID=A0AAV1ZQ93_9ARAC